MKYLFAVLTFFLLAGHVQAQPRSFQGSTPADAHVREFLNISRTDSIDFIRWKLVLNGDRFELNCSYGLSKPNTNGFTDEMKVAFTGNFKEQDHYFELGYQSRVFYIREIDENLIHLLDKHKALLKGNGGWSYTLSSIKPVKTNQLFYTNQQRKREALMAFEGRTPCEPLSKQIERGSANCYKLKWYLLLYCDATTGQPTHYLMNGTAYRQETMRKGNWDIITRKDGRIIYRLDPEKKEKAIHLLTADNTILLFTSPDGNPLVGNEDFSFTLSRTTVREKH